MIMCYWKTGGVAEDKKRMLQNNFLETVRFPECFTTEAGFQSSLRNLVQSWKPSKTSINKPFHSMTLQSSMTGSETEPHQHRDCSEDWTQTALTGHSVRHLKSFEFVIRINSSNFHFPFGYKNIQGTKGRILRSRTDISRTQLQRVGVSHVPVFLQSCQTLLQGFSQTSGQTNQWLNALWDRGSL